MKSIIPEPYKVMIDRVANGWLINAGRMTFVVEHDGTSNLHGLFNVIEEALERLETSEVFIPSNFGNVECK